MNSCVTKAVTPEVGLVATSHLTFSVSSLIVSLKMTSVLLLPTSLTTVWLALQTPLVQCRTVLKTFDARLPFHETSGEHVMPDGERDFEKILDTLRN